MQRNHLAIGLKNGRVEGDLRWMTVEAASDQATPRNHFALRPVHALMIGVPLGLAMWALIGAALLR